MGPLLVVEGQISPNPLSGLSPILVCLQVHLLVLDAAPQPFHEDVVHAPAPAVHAHLNALRQQHAGEGLAGELAAVNGGGMLGHWGGVKLYHLVCSCSAKKSELTGQHKCPHHLLREMACLRVGQQRTGRKVLMLPILREACLEFGRQLPLCYA